MLVRTRLKVPTISSKFPVERFFFETSDAGKPSAVLSQKVLRIKSRHRYGYLFVGVIQSDKIAAFQ